jgi:hypothetical protein
MKNNIDISDIKSYLDIKILLFISDLSKCYSKNYVMSHNIAIDESMIAFKGRSEYRLYHSSTLNPNKRENFFIVFLINK